MDLKFSHSVHAQLCEYVMWESQRRVMHYPCGFQADGEIRGEHEQIMKNTGNT